MINCAVIGASGYVGMELTALLSKHPKFNLNSLWVSEKSADANKPICSLYPGLLGLCELNLQGLVLNEVTLAHLANNNDVLFLCTEHEVAHDIVKQIFPLLAKTGLKIFDLSGGHRLNQSDDYAEVYGFAHQHQAALDQGVYGLPEWHQEAIAQSQLIAVPGCYPTASILALKPLVIQGLLKAGHKPVINAVSGISGAGRKATSVNSFCELSLQAYKVFAHRHQPEIEQELGCHVVFTPHIANYDRGILATIYCQLKDEVNEDCVQSAYQKAYASSDKVHCVDFQPAINHVKQRDHCLIHWEFNQKTREIIITSAIDNLLKGAASQALQCAELGCL